MLLVVDGGGERRCTGGEEAEGLCVRWGSAFERVELLHRGGRLCCCVGIRSVKHEIGAGHHTLASRSWAMDIKELLQPMGSSIQDTL